MESVPPCPHPGSKCIPDSQAWRPASELPRGGVDVETDQGVAYYSPQIKIWWKKDANGSYDACTPTRWRPIQPAPLARIMGSMPDLEIPPGDTPEKGETDEYAANAQKLREVAEWCVANHLADLRGRLIASAESIAYRKPTHETPAQRVVRISAIVEEFMRVQAPIPSATWTEYTQALTDAGMLGGGK